MKAVLLQSHSATDIKLIVSIAKKMGVVANMISDTEKEDMAMLRAMKTGRTNKLVDTQKFIKSLKK